MVTLYIIQFCSYCKSPKTNTGGNRCKKQVFQQAVTGFEMFYPIRIEIIVPNFLKKSIKWKSINCNFLRWLILAGLGNQFPIIR
jgi:hypothetical protein